MILLDTSVLSLAFRRSTPLSPAADLLARLIHSDENLTIPGIVLQEILSGLRERPQFERLQRALSGFPVLLATQDDHLLAAEIINDCRRVGISASTPDCLIGAMVLARRAQLLTTDRDFESMAAVSGLRLYEPPARLGEV